MITCEGEFLSHSEEETEQLAQRLAKHLFSGAFLALNGDLGAGKTAFVRGIARTLGFSHVNSPSFLVVQEYEGNMPLYHFDVYRLADSDELYDIGFADYMTRGGIICMEWPERVADILPRERIDVCIEGNGEQERRIAIRAMGQRQVMCLKSLLEEEK